MPFDIYMPTGTSGHGEHLLRCPSSHSNMSQQSNLFGKLKSKFSGSSSEKSQKLRFATPFGRKDTFQDSNATKSRENGDDPPAYSVVDNTTTNSNTTTRRPDKLYAEAATPSASATSRIRMSRGNKTNADTRYAFLSKFDTVVLVDDSYSMTGARWREVADALRAIAPICTQYDKDGIDICFLNHRREYANVRSAARVSEIFASVVPCNATFTGQRLKKILTEYLNTYTAAVEKVLAAHPGAKSIADVVCDDDDDGGDVCGRDGDGNGSLAARVLPKPLNIIVLTDGEPSDDVESVIIAAARRLDRLDAPAWQVGIQFFQIGQDEQARRHLKRLDDELDALASQGKGGRASDTGAAAAASSTEVLRDMVDTVPYADGNKTITAEGILKVVLGAVHRRYDRNDGTSGSERGRLHG